MRVARGGRVTGDGTWLVVLRGRWCHAAGDATRRGGSQLAPAGDVWDRVDGGGTVVEAHGVVGGGECAPRPLEVRRNLHDVTEAEEPREATEGVEI